MLLGLTGACGKVDSQPTPDAAPPVETHDGLKSGTRLKVRWNDFDGTKAFSSVWDSTRNEACTPRKFTDAKTYCVPTSGTIVYRDATCTMPIGRQSRTCPQTQLNYFTDTDPQTCDNLAKRIFPRGAQLGGTVSYYSLSGTTCSGPFDGSSFDMFALGTEIPLTEFATFETPTPSEPARFQQRFAESADGARIFAGIYDSELASDCFLTLDATRANARCVPSSTSAGTYFGDTNCAVSRTSYRKGCTAPKFSTRYNLFCAYTASLPDVFRNGALTGAAVFVPTGSTPACQAITPSAELSFYEVGAQVALDALARTPDTEGKGRYRLLHTSLGNSRLREPQLYDTIRQTECTPTTMQDGTVRCLPVSIYGMSGTIYYSDAACTVEQPITVVPSTPATGCTLPPATGFTLRTTVSASPTCTVTREVRQIGAAYTGSLYFKNGAACTMATFTGSAPYTLGDVGSLDDWPAANVVTDP